MATNVLAGRRVAADKGLGRRLDDSQAVRFIIDDPHSFQYSGARKKIGLPLVQMMLFVYKNPTPAQHVNTHWAAKSFRAANSGRIPPCLFSSILIPYCSALAQ